MLYSSLSRWGDAFVSVATNHVLHHQTIMTEFKKLTAAVDADLVPSIPKLFGGEVTDVRARHAILEGLMSSLPALQERFTKMMSRARESDPERQVFNEKTCVAMEALYSRFCAFLEDLYEWGDRREQPPLEATPLPGGDGSSSDGEAVEPGNTPSSAPTWTSSTSLQAWLDSDDVPSEAKDVRLWELGSRMQELTVLYARDVVERAGRDAIQREVAATLSGTVDQEQDDRLLVASTEVGERKALADAYTASRRAARETQNTREAAMWAVEVARREQESALMAERGTDEGFGKTLRHLAAMKPSRVGRAVLKAVLELIDEVVFRPENPHVRTIRNASRNFISTFGHPCVQPGCDIYFQVEVMLAGCGYAIRYSKKGTLRSKEVMGMCAPFTPSPSLLVPVGWWGDAEEDDRQQPTYTPLGFEEYGERLLELHEPNAMEDPDAWCVWHEAMLARISLLRNLIQ